MFDTTEILLLIINLLTYSFLSFIDNFNVQCLRRKEYRSEKLIVKRNICSTNWHLLDWQPYAEMYLELCQASKM